MKPPRPPAHGTKLSDKQAAEQDRKLRAAVSDARRKKAPVTLPSVKAFDSTQD